MIRWIFLPFQRDDSWFTCIWGTIDRDNLLWAYFKISFLYLQYMAIEPKIDLISGSTIPFDKLNGEIRFENVTFSYPSRPDQIILRDFNLVLMPGQTVALVGASGSGKSTVASLLERFYEPSEGKITLDNQPLSTLSPYWLRAEVIGFIEQQPLLFGTTILGKIEIDRNRKNKKC